MSLVIFLTSIYACMETAITGYLEYTEKHGYHFKTNEIKSKKQTPGRRRALLSMV